MTFLIDAQELKTGLIIFRRGDVKHRNWYCRIKPPKADRQKTVCLKTSDIGAAREIDHGDGSGDRGVLPPKTSCGCQGDGAFTESRNAAIVTLKAWRLEGGASARLSRDFALIAQPLRDAPLA